ncbi:BamA/TamA family outer membrane protein [Massilia sp. Dwa41.01b]|uniref:autotransporter assembly complex protein TamA n=1 Tax=Massilia sp. Dwa41.01b TaxID=2709302 RepID=UPI0016042083|nr:BamA/TamA family outer membrane protein [Massilia sp. Dwa41.01b]QNA87724.1 BamA/TamA family outer membrane protein [Massilia sp. Dwa41.01b]
MLSVYLALAAPAGFAQGIDYNVRIDAPGRLDNLLEDNLELLRWRGNPRVDLDQLQRLVKSAPEEAKTLLETEGYYSPQITATLDTSGGTPVARVNVDPGQPTVVSDLDLVLQGFVPFEEGGAPYDAGALRNRWSLPVGARFRMGDWEAAKRDLLREVMQSRFPRAQLVEHSATVDPDARQASLRVVIDSGPEMRFGELRIRGLKRYPATVITNLNKIKPGDLYSEAALQALQGRLQETGYFSSVEVSADMRAVLNAEIKEIKEDQDGDAPAAPAPVQAARDDAAASNTAPGQAVTGVKPPSPGPTMLPVLVRVVENKQKNVEIGVGFSTNTGGRASVSYDDLNVFGKRMKSDLVYEQKRQNARVDFYWPTTPDGYNDSVGGGIERTDLRGELLTVATVAARRAWGTPELERSLTLEALLEQREVEGLDTTRSKSVPLTYNVTRRKLDDLVQPTRGYALNWQVSVAPLPLFTDEKFIRGYTRGIYYRPVGTSGTLILRGEAGAVLSREKLGVPSTLLFRAGGDQSVRGYGYQQLGVREGEAIVGGRYLLTGGAEYQYWFRPPWGVAFFVDAGNAADKFKELKPEVGYGVGARWRSPVGPINVDIAYGQAVRKARLHFSLGFTF